MPKRNMPCIKRAKKAIRTTVHLYTGEGAGKTTSAFGVAMRMLGHNKKVVIVQFMKGRKDIGEYKIQKELKNYRVYQAGTKSFIDLKNPSDEDCKKVMDGIRIAKRSVKERPDLLVLDELGLAAARGLVDFEDVLDLLKKVPSKTHTYITGRENPKELFEIADFVTELKTLKQPSRPEYVKGIEY